MSPRRRIPASPAVGARRLRVAVVRRARKRRDEHRPGWRWDEHRPGWPNGSRGELPGVVEHEFPLNGAGHDLLTAEGSGDEGGITATRGKCSNYEASSSTEIPVDN